jgi:hypothetical protein
MPYKKRRNNFRSGGVSNYSGTRFILHPTALKVLAVLIVLSVAVRGAIWLFNLVF